MKGPVGGLSCNDRSACPIDAARKGESAKLVGGFAVQLRLTLTVAACALLRTEDCDGVQISTEGGGGGTSSTSSMAMEEESCTAWSPGVSRLIDSWITPLIASRVAEVMSVLPMRLGGEKKASGVVASTTSPLL